MMLSTVNANGAVAPDSRAALAAMTATAITHVVRSEMRMKSSKKGRSLYNRLNRNSPPHVYLELVTRTSKVSGKPELMEPFMRLRISIVASAILGMSVSAFGQSGQLSIASSLQQAAAQAAQTTASQPGETVRRLSIDDAVKSALEQNLGIRIQRIDPQIQDTGVAQARSFWAPNLSATFNKNSQTLQSTSAFAGSGASILNGAITNQL